MLVGEDTFTNLINTSPVFQSLQWQDVSPDFTLDDQVTYAVDDGSGGLINYSVILPQQDRVIIATFVPEPSSALMLLIALGVASLVRRRRS